MPKKVFVSGCYDLLHSGHVEFFRQAAEYGDLYVGIGSDATIQEYKHHKTVYSEQERLFMVKSIRYVKDAYINAGNGIMDFIPTVEAIKPDILVVNSDGGNEDKRRFCEEHGIQYVVLERVPQKGLKARSSTAPDVQIRVGHIGIGGGYGYNLVLGQKWLLHLSILPTFVVYNYNKLVVNDERREAKPMRFNMIFNERAAVIYNFSPRYFAGATLVMNNSLFDDEAVVVNQNKWRARAFFGFRL